MDPLTRLDNPENLWNLEDFTDIANEMLPIYVGTGKDAQKDINPRLVRYYTTQGLLDEPERQGKFAVYNYRNLLQLLVLRRLMSEGIGINAIGPMISKKTNQELKNLLIIGVQLEANPANATLADSDNLGRQPEANPANAALAYLDNLKNPAPKQRSAPIQASTWFHLKVDSGLEIMISSEFKYPDDPKQQKILQDKILQTLKQFIAKQREGKP